MTKVCSSQKTMIGLAAAVLAALAFTVAAAAPPAEASMTKCFGYGKNDFSGLKIQKISCQKAQKQLMKSGAGLPNKCPQFGAYGKCKYKKSGFKCKMNGKAYSGGAMGTIYTHTCKKETKKGTQKAKFYWVFTG